MKTCPHSDRRQIVGVAKRFLRARIARLEQFGSCVDFLSFFDQNSAAFRHLQYMADRIELEAGLRQRNDARVLRSRHRMRARLVGISGDYAEITVFERYDYVLLPVPDIDTSEATRYDMALNRVAGTWLLADIITDSDFDDAFRDTDIDVKTFLNYPSEQRQSAPLSEYFGPGAPDAFRADGDPFFEPYDAAAAVAYAERFALSYNRLFFSYRGLGGDCQNFASQCVWAGLGGKNTSAAVNLKMPPMIRTGPRAWFQSDQFSHDVFGHWTAVQPFSRYILAGRLQDPGPIGTITNGLANAAAGDLIQISDGKTWFHVYIVVAHTGTQGMRTTKDLWVSAHTTDRNRQWLATLITSAIPVRTVHFIGGLSFAADPCGCMPAENTPFVLGPESPERDGSSDV